MFRSKVSNVCFICVEINRKINIFQVDGVTISQNSKCHELVIHVKGEYDYRYVSPNYHELVASTIKKIVRVKGQKVKLYKVVSQSSYNDLSSRKQSSKSTPPGRKMSLKGFSSDLTINTSCMTPTMKRRKKRSSPSSRKRRRKSYLKRSKRNLLKSLSLKSKRSCPRNLSLSR